MSEELGQPEHINRVNITTVTVFDESDDIKIRGCIEHASVTFVQSRRVFLSTQNNMMSSILRDLYFEDYNEA